MKYTVHKAKTNLSKLIEQALRGEEVVIARGAHPVVRLVPIASGAKNRIPGRLKGKLSYAPDAFAPLTDKELDDLGFE
ncbi:MAG TPA: type II toxin-antitoxin system prevent-host-death family antitoxin [Terriglobales bacterium]